MKKGISPLISTVLLILFVVVLVVLIFNFSEKTTESGLEKGKEILEGFQNCEEVKFNLEEASCSPDKKGLLLVKITNQKKMDFKDGFSLRLFFGTKEEEEVVSFLYDTRLLAYESKELGLARPKSEGKGLLGETTEKYKEIKEVEVIPKVKAGNNYNFCNEKKQKIEVKGCLEESA